MEIVCWCSPNHASTISLWLRQQGQAEFTTDPGWLVTTVQGFWDYEMGYPFILDLWTSAEWFSLPYMLLGGIVGAVFCQWIAYGRGEDTDWLYNIFFHNLICCTSHSPAGLFNHTLHLRSFNFMSLARLVHPLFQLLSDTLYIYLCMALVLWGRNCPNTTCWSECNWVRGGNMLMYIIW